MANCQNDDLLSVVVIQSNVGNLAELNDPFAILRRQIIDRAANLGVLAQGPYALPDRFDGASCRILTFGSQKLLEAGYIPQSRLRPFQTWHFGIAARLPASSLASHSSASSAVRCWAVV